MYLYGASGHAKVIIDILKSQNINIDGLVDDNDTISTLNGYPVYHDVQDKNNIIISIGDNRIRKLIASKLNCNFGTAIASSAIISNSVKIMEGTVIMQGAIIQSDTIIGKHCIINTGSSIDHECIIDDFVHISPNATLCGNVRVGNSSHVGAGSVIIPGIKIGENCIIGAGTVVINSIPNNSVVVGNPGKIIKTI